MKRDEAHEETLAENPDRLARRQPLRRVEAMEWADDNDTDYIFGLPGNAVIGSGRPPTRFCHTTSSEARLRTSVSFM
jgi:hypothetical protein